jgi:hypothetical protein
MTVYALDDVTMQRGFASEACPILQTLGVIYSIEWALRHCETVIGECIVTVLNMNLLPPRLIIDRGFPEVSWIKVALYSIQPSACGRRH